MMRYFHTVSILLELFTGSYLLISMYFGDFGNVFFWLVFLIFLEIVVLPDNIVSIPTLVGRNMRYKIL